MPKILLFLAVALSLCPISAAVTSEETSLKGLQGVMVSVQSLEPEVEKAGLTMHDIIRDVELKLRIAGIPVLSEAQWLADPARPYLAIKVNVNNRAPTDEPWPYHCGVTLMQAVTLEGNPKIHMMASTWDRDGVGSVLSGNIRHVRDGIKDYVDQFINDYLTENPKK